jgi:FAD:protein FMN transferase
MTPTETNDQPANVVEITLNFRAMNTDIELLLYATDEEIAKAEAASHEIETLFAQTEALLSRFRPESELSLLNRQGYIENASELLLESLTAACQMRELTNGIFDPTILRALEAAGYDRSYELLQNDGPQLAIRRPFRNNVAWYDPEQPQIKIDRAKRSVQLAPNVLVDLGGIVKGATVDRAAQLLRQAGFSNFMIGAGGDMYLEGHPLQNSQGWIVGVANEAPGFSGDITSLQVSNKAVATSATTGRRWQLEGRTQHHLIDPRTQQPTDNGLAAVTVVADSVQIADVMAKTALILGFEQTVQMNLQQKANLDAILFVTLDGQLL